MGKVYLIPGLGADTRVYNKIDIENHDIVCVDWIEPDTKDTLSSYAQKLIHQYHIAPHSIVIGNSMGGMLAVEIAKMIPLKKVILISSILTVDAAPAYFRVFKLFPFYRLIPGKVFTKMGFFIKPLFGRMKPEDNWLFRDMLKKSSPKFLKWAMTAVLNWNNKVLLPNTITIIGDKDLVFPGKHPRAIIIKGGTHIMVFDRAREINKILKKLLKHENSR